MFSYVLILPTLAMRTPLNDQHARHILFLLNYHLPEVSSKLALGKVLWPFPSLERRIFRIDCERHDLIEALRRTHSNVIGREIFSGFVRARSCCSLYFLHYFFDVFCLAMSIFGGEEPGRIWKHDSGQLSGGLGAT